MKTTILRYAPVALMAFALASCSENSWNDQLDGFVGDPAHVDVQTISYTLTDADYSRIANNRFNKLLAVEDSINGQTDAVQALKAVASQGFLTYSTPAERYIPNLLNDSLFQYFTLSNGSAINLTYREVGDVPEIMKGINGCGSYKVTEADYQMVYDSEENYAPAFAPSYPAASYMNRILSSNIRDAKEGDYVVVNYNRSDVDPNFGGTTVEETEMTSVLTSDLSSGEEVNVVGVVTAICTKGFILSDKAGSILVYSNNYPAGTYKTGDQLNVTATLGYYKNCLQIPYDDATIKPVKTESYTYPEPVAFTPDMLKEHNSVTTPCTAVYGTITGTVLIDGNYMNLMFDGRSDVRGSIYNLDDSFKGIMTDGAKVTLDCYFTQTSQSGEIVNANLVVVKAEKAVNKPARKSRRVVSIPNVSEYEAYVYNGSSWKPASDIVMIQPADFTAMGLSYGNFSGTQAADYLPIYLKNKYPYATKDNEVYVAYKYYDGSATVNACALWACDGSKWVNKIETDGVQDVTSQFVRRDGNWKLDPSIDLTLPKGKSQPLSTWFFQACVDWVMNNVPDGANYVTSYGNNDYYTGASAYQGNIDLRASSARSQYATAYEGMTDDEIVALMKKRFEDEVCPAVLAELYPNMAPVGDFFPTFTIHFYTYNGTSTYPQTIVYEVTAPKTFTFVSCTWNSELGYEE